MADYAALLPDHQAVMNWLGVRTDMTTRTQITRLGEIFRTTMASKAQFADEGHREDLLRQQLAAILPD